MKEAIKIILDISIYILFFILIYLLLPRGCSLNINEKRRNIK